VNEVASSYVEDAEGEYDELPGSKQQTESTYTESDSAYTFGDNAPCMSDYGDLPNLPPAQNYNPNAPPMYGEHDLDVYDDLAQRTANATIDDDMYGEQMYDDADTPRGNSFTDVAAAEFKEVEFYGSAQVEGKLAATASQLPSRRAQRALSDKTYGEIVFDVTRPVAEGFLSRSVEHAKSEGRNADGTFLLRASSNVISGLVISVWCHGKATHFSFVKPKGSNSYLNSAGKPLGDGLVGLVHYFMEKKDGLPHLLTRHILPRVN